jgi:LacI family fructose operon transcriptional repressor
LIDQGHRRIGGIFGLKKTTTGRERYEGYLDALRENGISPEDDLIFHVSPKESEGFTCTSKLLQGSPPTALITGNNLLGEGAIRAIREAGFRIPDDITLAVFDNPSWTSLISFPLTVVSQPTYMLGSTAAELILKRINDPERPTQEVMLKTKLIAPEK